MGGRARQLVSQLVHLGTFRCQCCLCLLSSQPVPRGGAPVPTSLCKPPCQPLGAGSGRVQAASLVHSHTFKAFFLTDVSSHPQLVTPPENKLKASSGPDWIKQQGSLRICLFIQTFHKLRFLCCFMRTQVLRCARVCVRRTCCVRLCRPRFLGHTSAEVQILLCDLGQVV